MKTSHDANESCAAFPSAVDPSLLGRIPPPWKKVPPQASKYNGFFHDWRKRLDAQLKASLPPSLDPIAQQAYTAACRTVEAANTVKRDATAVRDKLQNAKPVDQTALDDANVAVTDATEALQDAVDTCEAVAVGTILEQDAVQALLSTDYDDADLVTYSVIMHATPKILAQWCDQSEDRANQLIAALKNTDLLRLFWESGGARNGQYGPAVELYYQIQPDDPVLRTLALAVALELCDPLPLFSGQGQTDALQRYVHYEQAYLLGELDPHFSQWTVWEMRNVINSDASEEELSWGRQCLLNYRPDHALTEQDSHWLYNRIVKTDVSYAKPDWYKKHRSYDQILSGGGKCGPRAWYGRFICKAFGMPTWGCKQPGHAAMVRWTEQGWVVCLGGGMWKSWWDDQGGLDFLLESQARAALDGRAYEHRVVRLEWVAAYLKEDGKSVRRNGVPSPTCPWYTLGMMQRKHLAAEAKSKSDGECPAKLRLTIPSTKAAASGPQEATVKDDGTIVLPATSCSSPTKRTPKVLFLPCVSMGGQQLYLAKDAVVEYTLPASVLPYTDSKKYKLTLTVCTAHRKEDPLPVKVGDAVSIVNLPYTEGMWDTSDPVVVELGGSSTTIRIARPQQSYGFSLKELTLVPV